MKKYIIPIIGLTAIVVIFLATQHTRDNKNEQEKKIEAKKTQAKAEVEKAKEMRIAKELELKKAKELRRIKETEAKERAKAEVEKTEAEAEKDRAEKAKKECKNKWGELSLRFQKAKGWNDDEEKIGEIKVEAFNLLESNSCSDQVKRELKLLKSKCDDEL